MQPHRMSGHAVHLQSRAHGSLLEDNIARKVPDPDLERRVLLIGLPFRLRAQQQAGPCCPAPQLAMWCAEVCLRLPAQKAGKKLRLMAAARTTSCGHCACRARLRAARAGLMIYPLWQQASCSHIGCPVMQYTCNQGLMVPCLRTTLHARFPIQTLKEGFC